MNKERINAIACEFAEVRAEESGLSSDTVESLFEAVTSNAEDMLSWLCDRYCLVEKSAVRNRLELAYTDKKEGKAGALGHCRWHELSLLFPDIAKEVENHESY